MNNATDITGQMYRSSAALVPTSLRVHPANSQYPTSVANYDAGPSVQGRAMGRLPNTNRHGHRRGQDAERKMFCGVMDMLRDPIYGPKLVRRTVKALNEGIVCNGKMYKDHIGYLKVQDAMLIWVLQLSAFKKVGGETYSKLATRRAIKRLKGLRMIDTSSAIPRLTERGMVFRTVMKNVAEKMRKELSMKRDVRSSKHN
ncbi:MAG: hypothetical protein QXI60_00580 [Thermofilaceae archaeon]